VALRMGNSIVLLPKYDKNCTHFDYVQHLVKESVVLSLNLPLPTL